METVRDAGAPDTDLTGQVALLRRELHEARQQQAATANILQVISRPAFDLDIVLTTIIQSAIELCDAARGVVWLRRGEELFLAAHVGYSEEWVAFAQSNPITPSVDAVTASGLAAFTGEIVHVEDILSDPRFRSLAAHKLGDYRAGLTVPLKREGRVEGVISLSRPEARLFTDHQVELVTTFADQAVIAIENVRLFEQVQARTREVTEALEQQTATSEVLGVISRSTTDLQPVLESIASTALRLCEADYAHIYKLAADGYHYLVAAKGVEESYSKPLFGTPVGPDRGSLAGRAVLERRTVHIPNVLKDPDYTLRIGKQRSGLGVPLLREGAPTGVIVLLRTEVKPFTARQIELVTTFADQAVIAIENVRLFEEVQARNREVTNALEQQTATSEILRVISTSPTDVQPVFETIVRNAVSLCGSLFANVFRFDGELLHFVASHNVGADYEELLKARYPMRPDPSQVSGRVILNRSVVRLEDVLADPHYDQRFPSAMGWRRMLGVPMLREEELLGVIVVGWAEAGPVPKAQEELLKTFADQAVIAIENVRLFEEVQARTEELQESLEYQTATSDVLNVISRSPSQLQPVLDTIVETAGRLCEAYDAAIFLRQGDSLEVAVHRGPIPVDYRTRAIAPDWVTGRAVLDRRPVHVHDLAAAAEFARGQADARRLGFRTILSTPLVRDDVAIGAIMIRRQEVRAFSDKQLAVLQTFADQAVIAIENVRLFDEVQAKNRELAESLEQQVATSAILRAIAASPTDIGPVLQTVAESAAQLCDAYDATLFLPREGALAVAAHHGPIAIDFPELPIERGVVTSRAFLDREPVHVHDLQTAADEFPAGQAYAQRLGFRTILSTPLLREGEAIGALMIRRSVVRPFTEKQIELVQTFADQAVIAIENVRLFEEVQARTAELQEALDYQTATSDVLNVISRSPSIIQPVLDTIVETAARLCDAERALIHLYDGAALPLAASHNVSPELMEFLTRTPITPGRHSGAARAALEKQTIHIPDVRCDPEYTFGGAQVDPIRTVLAVPMLKAGDLVGVLVIYRLEVRPFTPGQVELVTTFADQAVIAIENVRLFDEVEARTRELQEALEQQTATADILTAISHSLSDTQPVFGAIVQSGLKLFSDAAISIALPEGDQVHAAAVAESDPPRAEAWRRRFPFPLTREYLHGIAILERRVVDIPDVADAPPELAAGRQNFLASGYRAVTILPLMRGGEAIGALSVVRVAPGPLSEKQHATLQTFASQAVIAIENTRLLGELRESLQQQTATADVLKVISRSTFDLPTVLQTLVESAARLCDADKGTITRSIDGVFYRAEAVGFSPEFMGYARQVPVEPERGSATGRALLEGKVVHIPDVRADPDYTWTDGQKLGGFRTILGVPMLREGVPIGVLALTRDEVRPFTEKQIELVSTFADQAVIALENARLFSEVQAKTHDLEEALAFQKATGEVLEVIGRSASTLQPVLDAIVDTAADLCRADMSFVRLLRDGALHYAAASKRNDPAIVSHSQNHPILPTDRSSVAGRVALEARTIHIRDIAADPEYSYLGRVVGSEVHSILGVPLLQDGNVVGVIALLRKTVDPFTDRQIALVETFADQAVIAMKNVRLFEEVQARTEELSRSLDELRAAQDRLVQTEKLASLGQLTAGIAHEIKNPLNFVNNFSALSAELIEELREALQAATPDGKLNEEVAELTEMLKGNLEKVVQHGKRADSIVKNMLLHSRAGSGEHRPASINAIVEEGLNLAYHGARAEKQGFNITLERDFDPAAGEVDVFPQEITRVLLNLFSNGFYATTKRKAAADGAYEPKLLAATRNLGDRVQIRIRDNGTGIPPEVKEKMFNPFFTTKPAGEGTGLGLSLSHDIVVKQHAGTIEVETEPGVFTEFRIVLPRAAASLGKSGGEA